MFGSSCRPPRRQCSSCYAWPGCSRTSSDPYWCNCHRASIARQPVAARWRPSSTLCRKPAARGWPSSSDVQNELALRNVAWVLTDGDQPNHRSVLYSADFTYVRWNRSGLLFSNWREIQHDRSADLDWWAATLREAPVETVFGYMSNEFAGHAPASLAMLKQRLQLPVSEPQELWQQRAL